MSNGPNQSVAIPVEVRKAIREWVIGTYGLDNPGIPLQLIEKLVRSGQTIYRIEADVKDIVTSSKRTPVFIAVIARSGAAPEIDQDSVVFFDE
jgi:hypothetical protein